MVDPNFIRQNGQTAIDYIESIDDAYKSKWEDKLNRVKFTDEQLKFLQRDFLPVQIVVVSADWCPDCRAAVPIVIRMAEISNFLNIVIIDRDKYIDQSTAITSNGSVRVPIILFTNENYEEITRWIERAAFTYTLQYKSKLDSIKHGKDMKELMGEHFSTNSDDIVKASTVEIFNQMRKAVYLLNASAPPEKISPTH